MLKLEFETDFIDDDQTSPSNPPGPPAGDGSSGKDRNTISEAAVVGVRRDSDSHGLGRNVSKRRNDNQRRNHNERQNENRDRDTFRDNLRHIALETLQICDDGEYFPPGQDGPYDLRAKIRWTADNTRYYGPDAGYGGDILESEFIKINKEGGDEGKEKKEGKRNRDGITGTGGKANDESYLKEKQGEKASEKVLAAAPSNPKDQTRVQAILSPDSLKEATLDNAQTTIYVGEYSTLVGARKVYLALARNTDQSINKKIGVLNFASAKRPGGGFIRGCQAQEESLARASTLYSSLITDVASQFYTHYLEDPDNAYYTHAMVYSPGIVLIRDDKGEWRSPVEVDILTSAAVNAGEIRRELEGQERLRKQRVEIEYWKKRGEERRKENDKATAERRRLREEEAKNKKGKEEIAKLKEHANPGSEKARLFVENEKGEEVDLEGNQRNTIGSPDDGLGSSQLKGAEGNTKSKGTMIQDDRPQPPEVSQEPTSSTTIFHPLLPPTQPSQAPDPDPYLTYALALENAEIQIEQTMYARISRILHLFLLHKTPYLILGSFGTGVFKNRIELIAAIFADLLIKPGGRFKDAFQTVVFAILGKETVKVFSDVFKRADKGTQRERTGKTCVFVDAIGSGTDGDVKEGDEEKTRRLVRWDARRRRRKNSFMYVIPDAAADATSLNPAQVDAASPPLSLDAAQASAVPYPNSSAATDAVSHPPSFDAAQGDRAAYATSSDDAQASVASCPPSSDATQASAIVISYPTSFTAAQADVANPTTADYYAIPGDAKMALTRGNEQVDFVTEASANVPITPKAMVVEDGKDIDTIETKSLPTGSHGDQNSRSNMKEDDDVESLRLRDIAQGTIKAIKDGYIDFLDSNMLLTRHNIRQSADDTVRGTEYFKPDTPWLRWWWQDPLGDTAERHSKQSGVLVQILKMSILQGSHFLSQTRSASKIGVLSFASATKPGGEFMNGASGQEESIARSSTLYLSLQTRQATPFYELHGRDNRGGYYSHGMIYSPSITIFRDDNGDWLRPYHVDIVTSPAVDAGLVRKPRLPDTERKILSAMRERIGRILALFERSGVRNLVLGSFGTGFLQNDVGSLAKIWGELLGAPGARFAVSFDQVIFTIPDSYTRRKFGMGFNVAANPPRRHREFSRDAETNFTNKSLTLTPLDHSHEAQNSRSNKKDHAIDPERLRLRDIAQGTIKAIKDGYVNLLDSNMHLTTIDIRQFADDTVGGTEYFKPDTPWLKWWWQDPLGDTAERHGKQSGVRVQILKMSTLQSAHSFSQTRPASKIGVLNFASATKPGGEFMNGASGEEESIARSSTLYLSLQTRQATPFYELHVQDNRGGYYSHGMIYSPSITIFRDDNGDWLRPYHVDIVTSPAVDAGLVRKPRLPDTERRTISVMRERIGRILALFERSGVRNLVLGSFGAGFLQNDVGSLAKIWGELLGAPGARFAVSFDQVIFTIPDSYTRRKFRTGFNAGANSP